MTRLTQQQLLRSDSYINGKWVNALSDYRFDVFNPSTGELITQCADLGVKEVKQTIELADVAHKKWRQTTAKERSIVLRRWFDLVMEHQEELASILSLEQGRPIREARAEITYGASFIEWFAEEAKRTYGDTIPTTGNDKRLITIKQPVGVVAAITPWNFPNAMITRKAAPAIAAGCSIVVKPAKETPLSALALAVLAEEAGIPPGVLNVVTSSNSRITGLELTTNPLVKKVTFTGSTQVGKILLTQCAQTVKKVSMELGGNAPVIVFDDADIEGAASAAATSKFRNCGQTCICANRILVHEDVYDNFVRHFVQKTETLRQGKSADETTDIGPLINADAFKSVADLVNDATEQGAIIAYAGAEIDDDSAFYYPPTVLRDVPSSARVSKEEIFGPVAPIFKFSTEEEAINIANDTEYGLAAYIFTKDLSRAWRVSEAIEYGMVGVNETAITSEVIPFGGIKESGLGREGSRYGMDDYLEVKYICMGSI